jgi:cytochrome c oxidase subunit 2
MFVTVTVTVFALAACGGSDAPGSKDSPVGAAGEQIARQVGCASCHGGSFEGSVGPGWVGLAGSEVELRDGTTVVADGVYLFESIRDPAAQVVAGYGVQMPRNALTDDEIDEIVAFIGSLADA